MAVARKAKTAGEASKNTAAATSNTGGERGAQSTQQDAVALLKADHRQVEQLFKRFESAGDEQKQQIVKELCTALIVHSQLEEEIFYPACRQKADDAEPLDEAQVEHDGAKVLIADLMSQRPGSPYFEAKVTVLQEYIRHHVAEEEKPNDGILAKAASAGVDMQALGARLAQRKQELQSQASSGRLPSPQPRSFEFDSRGNRNHMQEGQDMERRFDRDRDERGRFTSDDDDYGRGGRGSSRGREDFGGGRYANERERDDRGRFMSDDDGRSSGSRGGGGGSEGRGWHGDPQGHAEASRRGWEEREGNGRSSSRGRDDDDDRRYSSSRGGGEGRGWYGDPQGHSEASRRGWDEREGNGRSSSRGRDDDDDRRYSSSRGGGEGRGWYGDPQGHSEASRRGWDEREGNGRSSSRGRDDDDDRRYSSRGGSDDDDRRGGGRDQGGWFGDSRGHAEAARKGWRNRD